MVLALRGDEQFPTRQRQRRPRCHDLDLRGLADVPAVLMHFPRSARSERFSLVLTANPGAAEPVFDKTARKLLPVDYACQLGPETRLGQHPRKRFNDERRIKPHTVLRCHLPLSTPGKEERPEHRPGCLSRIIVAEHTEYALRFASAPFGLFRRVARIRPAVQRCVLAIARGERGVEQRFRFLKEFDHLPGDV